MPNSYSERIRVAQDELILRRCGSGPLHPALKAVKKITTDQLRHELGKDKRNDLVA